MFGIRLAIGICSVIVRESERYLKPLKPPFNLGRPMCYLFHGVFIAQFSLHIGQITGNEQVKQCNNIYVNSGLAHTKYHFLWLGVTAKFLILTKFKQIS